MQSTNWKHSIPNPFIVASHLRPIILSVIMATTDKSVWSQHSPNTLTNWLRCLEKSSAFSVMMELSGSTLVIHTMERVERVATTTKVVSEKGNPNTRARTTWPSSARIWCSFHTDWQSLSKRMGGLSVKTSFGQSRIQCLNLRKTVASRHMSIFSCCQSHQHTSSTTLRFKRIQFKDWLTLAEMRTPPPLIMEQTMEATPDSIIGKENWECMAHLRSATSEAYGTHPMFRGKERTLPYSLQHWLSRVFWLVVRLAE